MRDVVRDVMRDVARDALVTWLSMARQMSIKKKRTEKSCATPVGMLTNASG